MLIFLHSPVGSLSPNAIHVPSVYVDRIVKATEPKSIEVLTLAKDPAEQAAPPDPVAAAANAAETSGEDGLLSGTQSIINVDVPVDLGDVAVSVIGDSRAESSDQTDAAPAAPAGW